MIGRSTLAIPFFKGLQANYRPMQATFSQRLLAILAYGTFLFSKAGEWLLPPFSKVIIVKPFFKGFWASGWLQATFFQRWFIFHSFSFPVHNLSLNSKACSLLSCCSSILAIRVSATAL